MDTSGHHSIAEVGEELLKRAIREANPNRPEMRIAAFYLGNWLTDVSQAVDPVAYRNAATHARATLAAFEALFERMVQDAPSWGQWVLSTEVGQAALRRIRSELRVAKSRIEESLRILLDKGRDGSLADGFRNVFRFVGYAKFVLDDNGAPTNMHEASYLHVFANRFTQYFPHEHLDRPGANGRYATGKSSGPLNPRSRAVSGSGDLYTYLRQDIKVAGGLLAYLDGGTSNPCTQPSWASGTFHRGLRQFADSEGTLHPVSDENPEWNLHLAMLGHALHAIEDFFAHSTFVEHAAGALPPAYRRFSRLEMGDILARRLKEWRPNFRDEGQNWRSLSGDTHVVTGYFDTMDTLVSLGHVLEKAFDRPHDRVGQDVDHLIEYDYAKLLSDTLEFVDKPEQVWDANDPARPGYDDEQANVAVKWLREQGGRNLRLLRQSDPSLNRTIGMMLRHPLLANRPQEIKDSFAQAVRTLGAVYGGGRLGLTVYRALKDLTSFLETPLVWLKEFVGETVYEYLRDKGEVYIKNLLYEYLGSLRIGCHSLIAKDAGPELFHDAAMNCAKAVHWYVIQTISRHSRHGREAYVCRSGNQTDARTALVHQEWIDWLELLEHFLSHPFTQIESRGEVIDVPSIVFHTTRSDPSSIMSPDSLLTLAREYAPTHVAVPGGPQSLTWEVIADANFPTTGLSTRERQARINDVLRHQPEASALTRDGINYAFKGGVLITIPYQRVRVSVRSSSQVSRVWWHDVIVDGWRRGIEDLGHSRIAIPHGMQRDYAEEARQLRRSLEQEYGA